MSDLATLIKEVAHTVSDDYLRNQTNMSDAIFAKANESGMNNEIVKRICELANQNVYLSLFHDSSINKANIQFEMADCNQILDKLQKSEKDMNEYKKVPKSFKADLSALINKKSQSPQDNAESEDFQNRKLASMDELQYTKDKYQKLLNSIETMKVASEEETKEAFSQIFNNTKILVSQGESIADMAKVAMRYVKGLDLDMMKVAKVYDLISTELKNNGYTVNEELTKISSCTINSKSKILEPVKEYSLGIVKIASFNDICINLKKVISAYDGEIKKTAKLFDVAKKAIAKPINIAKKFLKENKKTIGTSMAVSAVQDVVVGGTAGAIGGKLATGKSKK